jgi:hypothetical protein
MLAADQWNAPARRGLLSENYKGKCLLLFLTLLHPEAYRLAKLALADINPCFRTCGLNFYFVTFCKIVAHVVSNVVVALIRDHCNTMTRSAGGRQLFTGSSRLFTGHRNVGIYQ